MKVLHNDGYSYYDWEDIEVLPTYFMVTYPAYPDEERYSSRIADYDNVITYYTRKFSLRLL